MVDFDTLDGSEELAELSSLIGSYIRDANRTGFKSVARLGAMATAIGGRKRNEDRVAIARFWYRGRWVLLGCVADGIGGLQHGAECASIVTAAFLSAAYLYVQRGLTDVESLCHSAANFANDTSYRQFRGKAGSTLVAFIQIGTDFSYVWAGDSRIYGVHRNGIEQLSVDDTMLARFSDATSLDDSLRTSRGLLQHVGMGPDFLPHVSSISLPNFDRILLCSDGTSVLPAPLLERLAIAEDPASSVRHIVTAASWMEGHQSDNATVVLLNVIDAKAEDPRWNREHLAIYTIDGIIAIPNRRLHITTTSQRRREKSTKQKPSGKKQSPRVDKGQQPPLEITD